MAQSKIAPAKPDVPASAAAPTAGQPQQPPLAAGKAAGVEEAQGGNRAGIWNYVPFGVVGGLALIVVLTGNGDNNAVVVTTTSTGN